MTRGLKMLLIAPLAILGMLFFAFAGGGIVMLLWNWLLPPLAGAPQVTFWQALGLLVLCRILFGGFGRGGSCSRIRRRIEDRWDSLTPEERERFRQRMRERRGYARPPGESQGPG